MLEKQAALAELQNRLIEVQGQLSEIDLAKVIEIESLDEEMQARLKESLAKAQGQMSLDRELKLRAIELEMVKQQEMMKNVQEMAEKELDAAVESAERMAKEIEVKDTKAKKALIEGLYSEGILSSKENYSIIMTNKSLKVNGEKQSEAVFQKYWKQYQEYLGGTITGKYKVTLKSSNF
ncbi:MAG: hypothetical protein AAF242_14950 [Bacteroidota bacterium]